MFLEQQLQFMENNCQVHIKSNSFSSRYPAKKLTGIDDVDNLTILETYIISSSPTLSRKCYGRCWTFAKTEFIGDNQQDLIQIVSGKSIIFLHTEEAR